MNIFNLNSLQGLSKFVDEAVASRINISDEERLIEKIKSLGVGINQLNSSDCFEVYKSLLKLKRHSVLRESKAVVEDCLHSLNNRVKALSSKIGGSQEHSDGWDKAMMQLISDPKEFLSSEQFAEFISTVHDKRKRFEIAIIASEFVSKYIQLFNFKTDDPKDREMLFAIAKHAAEKDPNFLKYFDCFGLYYESYEDDKDIFEIERIINELGAQEVSAEVNNSNKIEFIVKEKLQPVKMEDRSLPMSEMSVTTNSNQEQSYGGIGSLAKLWDNLEDITENEDKYHVFQYREGIDLEKANKDLFPAIETDITTIKSKISYFKERFNLLGIKIIMQNDKELLQLPSRETLERNWKKLQELYPNTPDIKIRPSEGIASNEDFVAAFQRGEIILSSGIENVHDFQAHLIPIFSHLFNEQLNYENRINIFNQEIDHLNKNYKLFIPFFDVRSSLEDFTLAIDRVVDEIEEIGSVNEHIKELIKERVLKLKGRLFYVQHKIEELKKYVLYNHATSPYYFLFQGILTDVATNNDDLIDYSNSLNFYKQSTNQFRVGTIHQILLKDSRWELYIDNEMKKNGVEDSWSVKKLYNSYMNQLKKPNEQVIIAEDIEYPQLKWKGDLVIIRNPSWYFKDVLHNRIIEKLSICGYQEKLHESDLQFLNRIKILDLSEAIMSYVDLEKIKKFSEENCPSLKIIEPSLFY